MTEHWFTAWRGLALGLLREGYLDGLPAGAPTGPPVGVAGRPVPAAGVSALAERPKMVAIMSPKMLMSRAPADVGWKEHTLAG